MAQLVTAEDYSLWDSSDVFLKQLALPEVDSLFLQVFKIKTKQPQTNKQTQQQQKIKTPKRQTKTFIFEHNSVAYASFLVCVYSSSLHASLFAVLFLHCLLSENVRCELRVWLPLH